MKQTNKRKKTPTKPRAKTPQGKRWLTLGVEVIVFAAFLAFGFAVVSIIVRSMNNQTVVDLSNIGSDEPVIASGGEGRYEAAYGLYEKPSRRGRPEVELSPVFTPSIQYWRNDILKWSAEHGLDPNLVATVMQIESCGLPTATSVAGAMGLFQVMPFHFEAGEDGYDPETNAYRGMLYLRRGLEIANGHAGLAMAGYNGGHSVINRSYDNWANETQRYYRWGSGIYREASVGWQTSPTLEQWYQVGGASLCAQAVQHLSQR